MERVRVRCRSCGKELEGHPGKTYSCGCPNMTTVRDNNISPMLLPDIIYKYAMMFNKAYCVVESNDAGQLVCNGLYYIIHCDIYE